MSDKAGRAKRRAKQRADLATNLGRRGDDRVTKDTPAIGYDHATVVVRFTAWHGVGLLPRPLNLDLAAPGGNVDPAHVEHGVASFLRASVHKMPSDAVVRVHPDMTGYVIAADGQPYASFAWSYERPTSTAPTNITK